jgi:hypothetical protein
VTPSPPWLPQWHSCQCQRLLVIMMTELKKSGWAPAQAILPGRAKTSSSRPNSEHFLVVIRVQQATARRGRHCQTGYAAAASGSHCRLVQRMILRTRTPGQPEANLKLTVTVTVAVPLASPRPPAAHSQPGLPHSSFKTRDRAVAP